MEETILTPTQAAERLGVSRETVIRWCRAKRFKGAFVMLGSRKLGWRIPESSVLAILEHVYEAPVPEYLSGKLAGYKPGDTDRPITWTV